MNVCPKCGQVDQIQKLTAIVSAGTHRTVGTIATYGRTNVYNRDFEYTGNAYSSSSTQVNTVARTELTQKLSPPQRPNQPIKPSDDVGTIEIVIGLIISTLILCVIAFSIDSWLWMGVSCIAVPAVIGVLIGWLTLPKSQEREERYQLMMKEYLEILPQWEKMHKQWEQMYYCYRDDVVFIPGRETYAKPDDIEKLYIRA